MRRLKKFIDILLNGWINLNDFRAIYAFGPSRPDQTSPPDTYKCFKRIVYQSNNATHKNAIKCYLEEESVVISVSFVSGTNVT